MSTIQLLERTFEPYIRASAIQQRIRALAEEINRDYAEKALDGGGT